MARVLPCATIIGVGARGGKRVEGSGMSHDELPDASAVNQAIEIYLQYAYGADGPPASARNLVTTLRDWNGDFYAAPSFARTGDAQHPRLSIRLGNRFYPHMKLVLDPAPTGPGYLFKADTHDRHIVPPPGHPELGVFMDLRAKNQKIAEEIEQAWADVGIPTFKTYLHADLA